MTWKSEALTYRERGMTFDQIGRLLGISRQRVGQVLRGMKRPSKPARVVVTCKCCGKKFEARRYFVDRGWGQYCSRSCRAKFTSPIVRVAKEQAARRRERFGTVKSLLESGLSYRKIGRELGLSETQIASDAKDLGYYSGLAKEQAARRRERFGTVKSLLESGLSYRKIARELGLSETQIARDAKDLGLHSILAKEQVAARRMKRFDTVKSLLETGLSYRKIARELGLSHAQIVRDAKHLGRHRKPVT